MFFHFKILLYSLIFFFLLQFVSDDVVSGQIDLFSKSRVLLTLFILLCFLIYFYQIAKRISRSVGMIPVPIFLVISTFGLLYFVQSTKQAFLLSILSSVMYYFIHIALYRLRNYGKDKTARGIVAAASVATIFLFYATAYGIYLNFAISLWILMFSLMVVTTLVSFQYFWLINEDKKNVLNFSLVLGFVMAEIVWVLNFWPFGYLTTGVITLIFYYVFWDLMQCHFLDNLSKKRVVVNMFIFVLLVAMVLSSTRWLPIM